MPKLSNKNTTEISKIPFQLTINGVNECTGVFISNSVLYSTYLSAAAYLEPCQTSMVERFDKIVKGF